MSSLMDLMSITGDRRSSSVVRSFRGKTTAAEFEVFCRVNQSDQVYILDFLLYISQPIASRSLIAHIPPPTHTLADVRVERVEEL